MPDYKNGNVFQAWKRIKSLTFFWNGVAQGPSCVPGIEMQEREVEDCAFKKSHDGHLTLHFHSRCVHRFLERRENQYPEVFRLHPEWIPALRY